MTTSELPAGWERPDLDGPPGLLPEDRWPDRYSQTLLRHRDDCHRSAWLYLRGGGRSHPLDRGTAAHEVWARMVLESIRQGEWIVGDATKAIVEEVRRELPHLVVSAAEWDDIRMMAWHVSRRPLNDGGPLVSGVQVDPSKVVAVERKFLLPIEGELVSMRLDVGAIAGDVGQVLDWKSTPDIPSQDEFETTFQTKLYALGLVKGHPVADVYCQRCGGAGILRPGDGEGARRVVCPDCVGTGEVEELDDPIGGRLAWVRGMEVYPRRVRDNGECESRDKVWSRLELEEFETDVAALVRGIRADVRDPEAPWEAARNDHCSLCPSSLECPLPARMRELAGTINEPREAAAALEALEAHKAEGAAMQKEIRNWLKANGGYQRYGKDKVADFGYSVSHVTDWEAFNQAVAESTTFGTPFELEAVRSERVSTPLRLRSLTPAEIRELDR